jgi:hypothetical protein
LVPVAVGAGPEPHAAPEQPAFRAARTVVESVAPDEGAPEIDYPPLGRDAFETDAPVVVASPEMHGSAQTEVEDAEVMTNRRDAALGEPAFWRPAEPEEATADAPEQGEGGAADHDFAPVEPHPGYFDAPAVEEAAFSAQVAEPEPVAQVESEPHEETPAVNWDWAETATASDPPAPEESKPEPIAGPSDWLKSATPAVVSDAATSDVHEAEGGSDWPPGLRAPMVELNSPGGSAFAPSSAVWSEPEPAPTAVEPAGADSATAEVWPEVLPDAAPAAKLADTQRISAETLEAATHAQEESFASESPAAAPVDAAALDGASASGEAAGAKPTTDELVNAVVARVIEKLQPQIADMINEEILRPVVSALVRHELETK